MVSRRGLLGGFVVVGTGRDVSVSSSGRWREYAFEWTTIPETDTLYVSAGVAVIRETDATNYLDGVRVELRPR